MENVKKCMICGHDNNINAKFCVCCGRLLDEQIQRKCERAEEKSIGNKELKKSLSSSDMLCNGRKICEELRKLRLQFAVENNLPYEEKECSHQGPCNGTCEYCEQKLDELNLAAEKAGIIEKVVYSDKEVSRIIMQNSSPRLMGMMAAPDLHDEFNKSKEKNESSSIFSKLKSVLRK